MHAKEVETFHQCTTQARANIFRIYSKDAKDKGYEKMLIIMLHIFFQSLLQNTWRMM